MNNKRNTLQKQIVFDVFSELHNHPSAGMVYDEVHKKYPGISKATVYRLLAEAADEEKILRLKLVGASDRYDVTTHKHCHVVCRECGAVSDVLVDFDDEHFASLAESEEGFDVEECHMEFFGICPECKNNKK